MKIILGAAIGGLITISVVLLLELSSDPSERDTAIWVIVKNDTEQDIKRIVFESDKGQLFSCTLKFGLCSIGFANIGDSSFSVRAELLIGTVLISNIGYAEPGSTHYLSLSNFIKKEK